MSTQTDDTVARIAFVGGSELARDTFAHVMTEAGYAIDSSGTAAESTITLVFADNEDGARPNNERIARQSVLVADIDPDDERVADLVLDGADAVVSYGATAQDLANAIEAVAGGGSVIAPHPARRLVELARAGRSGSSLVRTPLTKREVDILQCIGRGESVKETANSLGISAKTVENLQSRLFRKLDVRNRAQAFARAHSLGLLPG